MEKHRIDFGVFESYHNRQVILNYYDDEDFLWKRDGFHFHSIQLLNDQLIFSKKDGNTLTISLKNYDTVARNNDFQNYFTLGKGEARLEIYLP
ncbi:hypothetical protein [Neobacillus sp. OS1-33]|jgi:hypothetical protein|uniref:hypothetical protein n=1 Tax=Neobacillus sp. OS1-33 TaxID=3070683 RepID=UPI0027E0EC7B|nr:hypothetical protein [Neobacillus sp. OS1-33]WML26937.1 hypothetical protein RCG22_04725 [Neobacillus sp. OS1-33]